MKILECRIEFIRKENKIEFINAVFRKLRNLNRIEFVIKEK